MIKNYIKESILKSAQGYKVYSKPIMIINPLPEEVDLGYITQVIESLVPRYMLSLIDAIYVGRFSFFEERNISALYDDRAIYVNSDQDDQESILDDIVHEISHALEENFKDEIYSDSSIEEEFLGKRVRLRSLIKYHNYDIETYDFLNPEYSEKLDSFFYQVVGYPILNALTEGLFASAYGATSLREYFANGFEEYVLGDRKYLNNISPKLYQKIDTIYNMEEKDEY